jgi:hypothetical protein
MTVLMVLVMDVLVFVLQERMRVDVLVMFRQM